MSDLNEEVKTRKSNEDVMILKPAAHYLDHDPWDITASYICHMIKSLFFILWGLCCCFQHVFTHVHLKKHKIWTQGTWLTFYSENYKAQNKKHLINPEVRLT